MDTMLSRGEGPLGWTVYDVPGQLHGSGTVAGNYSHD